MKQPQTMPLLWNADRASAVAVLQPLSVGDPVGEALPLSLAVALPVPV